MRIRALLVDDEESALRWLGELLSLHPEIDVVGTATSVAEAATLLEPLRPDVVFLDISMPRQGGMALFASVHADLRIVLVTAHDDRTLEAFEAGAFDYVLKPVTAGRLEKTMLRLRHALIQPAPRPTLSEPSDKDRVTVTTPTGTMVIPFDEVLWIEARQNYSLIRRRDGSALLVKLLLGDLGEDLPVPRFARIGRSLVINLDALRALDRLSGNGALLRFAGSGETLIIGRAATSRLRQLIAPRTDFEPPTR
jgi:two-component system LytT family response regulator